MDRHDQTGYWLTRILAENTSRLNDLPQFIICQEFSHVYLNKDGIVVHLMSGGNATRVSVLPSKKLAVSGD